VLLPGDDPGLYLSGRTSQGLEPIQLGLNATLNLEESRDLLLMLLASLRTIACLNERDDQQQSGDGCQGEREWPAEFRTNVECHVAVSLADEGRQGLTQDDGRGSTQFSCSGPAHLGLESRHNETHRAGFAHVVSLRSQCLAAPSAAQTFADLGWPIGLSRSLS
jgi:hypothetical protein